MFAANLKVIRAMFFVNCAIVALLPVMQWVELSWKSAGISVLLYYIFGACGIVATFHRFHSHGTYEFRYKWIEVLFTLLGSLSGSGSALGWAAMHRIHHKCPDTQTDPHSPVHGPWKTLTVHYEYGKGKWRYIRDLLAKPYVVFMHKQYFAILLAYVALLYLIAGLPGIYFGFCLPSVITLGMSGLTNYVSHIPWLGYQTHNDAGRATNAWWTSIFNCGEGWHNNHHHNPKSFTTKERWWEWDMAGSIIRLVKA